jgi:excisionase family DNA binding protein
VHPINHKEGRVQDEERLSLREAADALGVSEVTARRWVKSGKLRASQPGRKYLIPRSAVDELLESESPKDPELLPEAAQQRLFATVDVDHLNAVLADTVRQQREFRMQELETRLERAETDQERADAYRILHNWWTAGTGHVLINLFQQIPELMGGALEHEEALAVERIKEFARSLFADESGLDADLRRLEEAFKNESNAAAS